MFALTSNAKPSSLKRPDSGLVGDTGDRHRLPLENDFALFDPATEFIGY